MTLIHPERRTLHRRIATVGAICGTSFLLTACGEVGPLDGSISDVKALIAEVNHCEWTTTGPRKSPDGKPVTTQEFQCDGDPLTVVDGEFETFEVSFPNPDKRFPKKEYWDKYSLQAITLVIALLPHWKDGRIWLETNMILGLSDRVFAVQKVGDVWVGVERWSSALGENGAMSVFVTKDPDLAKYGFGHYVEDSNQ